MGLYIPEDGILHSHRRGNLKSYISEATVAKKIVKGPAEG
jgi:hypothetical protein